LHLKNSTIQLLGRDRLKREREKERMYSLLFISIKTTTLPFLGRKNIRKHREIMQELSANKKNSNSTF
jgi:hypothetical protein